MKNLLTVLLFALMAAGLTIGCDHDNDDDDLERGRNRQPAAGTGSIIFENDSNSAWNLDVNSQAIARVARGNFIAGDYPPGEHLVHLDQHEGSKEFDRTVTVVEGQRTIIQVDGFTGDFDVGIFVLP